MNNKILTSYWITKVNEHYNKYFINGEEPRYGVKTFFLYSYYLFKTLGEDWSEYTEGLSNIFLRDPSNDFYKYRDPTEKPYERRNALEWTTAFEVVANVGFPHNESAKEDFIKFSTQYLEKAIASPDSDMIEFMVSSAVANLSNVYVETKKQLPTEINKYLERGKTDPHQLMIYLQALNKCENFNELKSRILTKLIEYIKKLTDNYNKQILIWARLITRMQWINELREDSIKKIIKENFIRSLDSVYSVEWSNSPMILEALYSVSDGSKKEEILRSMIESLTPPKLIKLQELFPFLDPKDEALEIQEEVLIIKEKCKPSISQADCKECIINKKGDCWIRIISKLTNTEPKLHSGYEVADVVIYSLQQGIYFVIKATPITKRIGEGDILFRQCVTLFSSDHALIFYLNPCVTTPMVIQEIKKIATDSKNNPRFEIIDHKYIRQIFKQYTKL
jgi:hypothetical protein